MDKNNITSNDVDINPLNVVFSSIPVYESDIGYYNSTGLNDNGFEFSNVTLIDLRKSFCGIKSNAAGYDEMHPKFLKIILDYVIIYVLHIFNTILTTLKFPSM